MQNDYEPPVNKNSNHWQSEILEEFSSSLVEAMDLTHWREFDQFWEVLTWTGCLSNRELGSEVMSCAIRSPTHHGQSSTSLNVRGGPLHSCDQTLQLIHLSDSHTVCSLLYTATWMLSPLCGGWLGTARNSREQAEGGWRMEEGPKALFFWQHCLIWKLHKTVGLLYGDADGIVIKNRSTETLSWLNLSFTFSQKVTKYLKIKMCSNTETYWYSLVQHHVCMLFP